MKRLYEFLLLLILLYLLNFFAVYRFIICLRHDVCAVDIQTICSELYIYLVYFV